MTRKQLYAWIKKNHPPPAHPKDVTPTPYEAARWMVAYNHAEQWDDQSTKELARSLILDGCKPINHKDIDEFLAEFESDEELIEYMQGWFNPRPVNAF